MSNRPPNNASDRQRRAESATLDAAASSYTGPTPILPAFSPPPAPSAGSEPDEIDAFFRAAVADPDFVDIATKIEDLVRARHRPNTRRNYDYWLSRLARWLEVPSSRFRLRAQPAISLSSIFPIDSRVEQLIAAWLTDLYLGPVDPDERESWAGVIGPVAPSTFTQIMSALKARSSDRQSVGWAPSTGFSNWTRGMRRRLREDHGPDGQAEPLLGFHVTQIAELLHGFVSPEHLRDGLVLELALLGLTPGEIAKLSVSALTPANLDNPPDVDSDLSAASAHPSDCGWAVVVPGRRRRNGHQDPSRTVFVSAGSPADAALRRYLAFRLGTSSGFSPSTTPDSTSPSTALGELTPAELWEEMPSNREGFSGEGHLLELTGSNRRAHVRQILLRLASLAELDWEPSAGPPSAPEAEVMRRVVNDALDWPGQIRARRDQVMALVGYSLALRRSELCDLRLTDVSFRPGGGVVVNIVRSKTDQDANGKLLPISVQREPNPATDTAGLLRAWCDLLRSAGASSASPLFPAFDRWGHVLSRRVVGSERVYSAISPQSWSERLADLAREADVFAVAPDGSRLSGEELEEMYGRVSGHSLRRGFVTAALLSGADPISVAKHTRHGDVDMIMRYADELHLLDGINWSERIFGDLHGDIVSTDPSS